MKKVTLKIDGMSCSACSSNLEKYLNKQDGVKANVNLVLAEANIEYDDNISITTLEKYISEAGFKSLGVYDLAKEEKKEVKKQKKAKYDLLFLGIMSLIILYLSMGSMFHFYLPSFLNIQDNPFLVSFLLFIMTSFILALSFDIFKNGFKNLIHKMPNMDTLVTFGVLASFSYSTYALIMIFLKHLEFIHSLYFESAAIVLFFVKLGRFIDKNRQEKTKEALKELVQITPAKALLKVSGKEIEIGIDEIMKNDILIAKPGMKIAVDGVIVKGEAHLEEAFLTGESLPSKKGVDSFVLAGSVNLDGYLEYKALKIGKDSTISEIVRLVVEATNTKTPLQKIADKICGYFVPFILLIACLTFFGYLLFGLSFNVALISSVTVLVVACPCALGLATPLAIVTAVGTASKNGILIKNSETLEKINKITTVVFDKTGTLTYGNLKVAKMINYSKESDLELLQKVASIEDKSSHPIARALVLEAKLHNLPLMEVTDFENLTGIGVTGKIADETIYAGNNKIFTKLKLKNSHLKDEEKLRQQGCSIVYVICNQKVLGIIGVSDLERENASFVVKSLENHGKHVIMLTGDNHDTASIIAKRLGIKEVIANVMPQEKASLIQKLTSKGDSVMMVGDGVNDAISLVSATVGVSMHSATEIAHDSADVILMHDNLDRILKVNEISQKTVKIIKENLFWAFFYNILMIPIAMGLFKGLGISMNPMAGSLAMMISSLTVVLNSLRLRK